MQRTLALASIAAALTLGPATSPMLSPALAGGTSEPESALGAKIDAIAAKALTQPTAVGLSIAVAKGDHVIYSKGFGKSDLEFNVPADKDTMFRIGSVSKQFAAAAVMKLVEAGKLSPDDSLEKLMPELPPATRAVTLRQLLTHTSGVWSYTDNEKFMRRDASLELTPTELIATFKDHPLDFEPGSKWNYSNSGYYLIGEIVAKAAGKPYAKVLEEEFFTPLGLTRTRYESNREIIPNRAQGYSSDQGKLVNDQAIGADVPGAAGSLLSNAEGLVRWNLALSSGKVVSPASYAMMTSPTVLPDGKDTHYGFGLGINTWEKHKRIGHGGGIFGFTSQLNYFPEDGLTIAVISNSDAMSPSKIADSIARAALGISEFEPKDLPVSEGDFKRFVGEYKFETIPLEISLFERDGHLWGRATGQGENRLTYQGKGEFRFDFDNNVKLTFPEGDGPAESVVLTQGQELTAKRKK